MYKTVCLPLPVIQSTHEIIISGEMARRGYLNEDHIYHHYIQITQSTDPTESWFFVGKSNIHINSLSPEVFIICTNFMSTIWNKNNTKWAALA